MFASKILLLLDELGIMDAWGFLGMLPARKSVECDCSKLRCMCDCCYCWIFLFMLSSSSNAAVLSPVLSSLICWLDETRGWLTYMILFAFKIRFSRSRLSIWDLIESALTSRRNTSALRVWTSFSLWSSSSLYLFVSFVDSSSAAYCLRVSRSLDEWSDIAFSASSNLSYRHSMWSLSCYSIS